MGWGRRTTAIGQQLWAHALQQHSPKGFAVHDTQRRPGANHGLVPADGRQIRAYHEIEAVDLGTEA